MASPNTSRQFVEWTDWYSSDHPLPDKAKALVIEDDSNAPELLPGDRIVVDPTEGPVAGDVVVVATETGAHLLRKYRPRTGDVFEAVPTNPNYATLRSDQDGLTVVAVMIEFTRRRKR